MLALALLAHLCVAAVSAEAVAEPASYYVSLGDSLARGWQPGPDGRTRETTQGYVDYVASALRKREPALRSVKLGCPGETTVSMVEGGSCDYPEGSELARAEAFLSAHRGQVSLVTVNIGDNDVEQCLLHSRIDAACVRAQLATVRRRLPVILARLRAAAGADVPIVGLTDYDQFLAYWLDGPGGRQLARRSVGIVGRLNRIADAIYERAGALAADATASFSTTDLTHLVALRGHGRVPVAVERVCRWTWACSPPPIGFNDHANATGYRVLAQTILRTLRKT